jgi:triphosphatase
MPPDTDAATREKVEQELKLLIDPDAFSSELLLGGLAARPGVELGQPETMRVRDVYLDTRDRALARAGLSARWRRRAGKPDSLQVKPVPLLPGLLLERAELHRDLRRGEDAPTALRELLQQRLGLRAPGKLAPEVELRSVREVRRLALRLDGASEGCVAELSLDEVTALRPGARSGPQKQASGPKVPRATARFAELELELMEGSAAALRELSAWIAAQPGVQPSSQSKHRRALELLGQTPARLAPPAPRFGPLATVETVARQIGATQLAHIRAYEPGTRVGLDPEYLHKMRVATRRLRAALRVFSDCFAKGPLGTLQRELKWLADLLGAVRDLDVQLLALPELQASLGAQPESGWRRLRSELGLRRERARAELESGLAAPRYLRLLERAEQLFGERARRAGQAGTRPAVEAAAEILEARARKLRKAVKTCRREPSAEALHRLRIRGKQLRYACEFFGPLYGPGFDEQVARLTELQDTLGLFQDRVVTGRLAAALRDECLSSATPAADYLFVLGLLVAAGLLGGAGAKHELDRAYRRVGGRRAIRALARHAARRAEEVRAALAITGLQGGGAPSS